MQNREKAKYPNQQALSDWERGDELEMFATMNHLIVANTLFKQTKRRLYT